MSDWKRMQDWIRRMLHKRTKTDFLILILIGALLMIIAVPVRDQPQKKKAEATEGAQTVSVEQDYKRELEEELQRLLARMEGVGECSVMITLEDDGRTYVDKNVQIDEGERREETVVYRQEDGESPYVTLKRRPKVAGVVVVAEGGGSAEIAAEISNAVMSLFQLEAHKITVVKMSVQEE